MGTSACSCLLSPEHLAPAGAAIVAGLVGRQCRPVGALAAAFSFLWAASLLLEKGLGWLAGWGIGKTPKKFWWTIERIKLRPSLSWSSGSWSEISIIGWTWHNPPDFWHASESWVDRDAATDYLLQIDRLTLRLELGSVFAAIKHKKAIRVDLVQVEGLRFRTTRNREAALNLWTALDLPDNDVNVSAIVDMSRTHGGLDHAKRKGKGPENVKETVAVMPLPAIATEATRKASKFWKKQWFRHAAVQLPQEAASSSSCSQTQKVDEQGGCLTGLSRMIFPSSSPTTVRQESSRRLLGVARSRSQLSPAPAAGEYVEFAIGDKRRRPRWGVPVRFDIRKLVILEAELWILDLLTVDAHRSLATMDSEETKMYVQHLYVTRERLEAGDPRRSGGGLEDIGWAGDGVHGVYLGELVWVIIAEVVPLILVNSPSRLLKNALFATGFGIKDVARRFAAHAFEIGYNASDQISEIVTPHHTDSPELQDCCRLHVHLIQGRRMTREGKRVNVSAHLEVFYERPAPLRRASVKRLDETLSGNSKGASLARADSAVRLWTKAPHWDEHFYLGPVSSIEGCTLRISCIDDSWGEFGKVEIPLSNFRIASSAIDSKGDLVGWFPLRASEGARCTGQLKLGCRLIGMDKLSNGRSHDGETEGPQTGNDLQDASGASSGSRFGISR